MIHCPNCQFENPEDAKFCLECGQRMKRSVDPLVGQQIGNHRLVERIGVGGMGVIYRAEHINLGKVYAIKFLHPQFAADEEVVERFRREARVIASLDHESIVRETDFGWLDGVGFYLIMEFLKGENLKEVIKREGALEPRRVLNIFEQMLDALVVAHDEGVVHRDLKPENLFLVQRRNKEQLKILDFGIARILYDNDKREEFTMDGEVYGSPTYMSPEQARGDIAHVDPRSDLYSVGVILVEAMTGRPPYQGNTPAEVMLSHISTLPPRLSDLKPDLLFAPELEDVVIKSLAKESEDRYQNALAFWEALKPAIQRTIELRNPVSSPPPLDTATRDMRKVALSVSEMEKKTGKMQTQVAPEWFSQNSLQAGISQAPHISESLTDFEVPALTPESWSAPTMQDGAGRSFPPPPPPSQSWSFPAAQPVPPSPEAATPVSSTSNVSVQHQTVNMTPTPSYKQDMMSTGPQSSSSLPAAIQSPGGYAVEPSSPAASVAGQPFPYMGVGQPSPYMEATPQPHTVAASQLSSVETAISLTPSRSHPPSSPHQVIQPSLPQSAVAVESELGPRKQTGTELDSSVKPPARKRPFVWILLLAAVAAMVFGAIKLLAPSPKLVNNNAVNIPDAGLPSVPSLQQPLPRSSQGLRHSPKKMLRPNKRRHGTRHRLAPPVRGSDDPVVRYKPPPRRDALPVATPKARTSFRLHLKSSPAGADVFLAGQGKIATTPSTLQFLSGSEVTLIIRKDGYLTKSVRWRAEKHQRVNITLIPDPSQ